MDAAEYQHAVVYFLPDGEKPAPRAPGSFKIVTEDKRLKPDLLVIPKGSTVSFPNFDPILHNVFSVSTGNAFDVGIYGAGESRSVTLANPGIVLVNCNVHHAMQANILVMDTPYYTRVGDDGRFTLDNLPDDARGNLYVWQARANVHVQPVQLPQSGSLDISMAITKPRLIPHLNKLGKPYRPERGD